MNYEYLQRFFKPDVGYAGSTIIAQELTRAGHPITKQAVSKWKSRGKVPDHIAELVKSMRQK